MEHEQQPIPELLAPGGDLKSIKAAIVSGADAIYLGVPQFNARRRAENINYKELYDIVSIAHAKNIRIYITLNTLVTDLEIEEILEILNLVVSVEADAIILQDPGLFYIVKKYFPWLKIHASTQCTTHNNGQIVFLSALGAKQINFSRELSLSEITEMTQIARKYKVKSEVFVHGAYCVSFSGQCYMSSFIGGESGNRGLCRQPCRKGYSISEGGEKKYFLSLKDNKAYEYITGLINAGVDTFKIEGRVKGYHYVAAVVKAWKENLERLQAGKEPLKTSAALEQVFNRDFSAGYLEDTISPRMFIRDPMDQSLVFLGEIEGFHADAKILEVRETQKLAESLDVLIFTHKNDFICSGKIGKQKEPGFYFFTIEGKLRSKILNGQRLYTKSIITDPMLEEEINQLTPRLSIINLRIKGKNKSRLKIVFQLHNKEITVQSRNLLEPAKDKALNMETLKKQCGRLGDTEFSLGNIDISELEENLFLPVSELNNMRRTGIEKLKKKPILYSQVNKELNIHSREAKGLAVILSSKQEADYYSDLGAMVFLKINKINDFKHCPGTIVPLIPSLLFNKQLQEWKQAICHSPHSIIAGGNSALIEICQHGNIKWIAPESMNITNSYSLLALKENQSVCGTFLSGELNLEQLKAISPPQNPELYLKIFGPILLMTSRQCLLNLPTGCHKSKVNNECLEDCSKAITLYDEKEIPFHLVKEKGYYNEIYNNSLLSLPQAIRELKTIIDYFVLDFRDFPFMHLLPAEKKELFAYYKSYLSGENRKSGFPLKKYSLTFGNYKRGLS